MIVRRRDEIEVYNVVHGQRSDNFDSLHPISSHVGYLPQLQFNRRYPSHLTWVNLPGEAHLESLSAIA